jgi:hypothetical protein
MTQDPVFVGLSHIGQVFSIGWATKIGLCAAFDFNAPHLQAFQQGRVMPEEPDLQNGQCKHDYE